MKNENERGFIQTVLLILAAAIVLGGGIYAYRWTTVHRDITKSGESTYPTQYVSLTHSDAHTAVFIFALSIDPRDIHGENIERCVLDLGAAAQENGGNNLACTPMTTANDFSLDYNQNTEELTASDISPRASWTNGDGPFKIDCAACDTEVKFKNIHTSDGILLPELLISVPQNSDTTTQPSISYKSYKDQPGKIISVSHNADSQATFVVQLAKYDSNWGPGVCKDGSNNCSFFMDLPEKENFFLSQNAQIYACGNQAGTGNFGPFVPTTLNDFLARTKKWQNGYFYFDATGGVLAALYEKCLP